MKGLLTKRGRTLHTVRLLTIDPMAVEAFTVTRGPRIGQPVLARRATSECVLQSSPQEFASSQVQYRGVHFQLYCVHSVFANGGRLQTLQTGGWHPS